MSPRQWFAVGDPQTTRVRFFDHLARAGMLGADGRLKPEVGLLSIGDHFDFGGDGELAALEGLELLRWLASHPPEQCILLAGNHDLSRVTELAFESDASFAEARAFAADLAQRGEGPSAFTARFPRIPTPGLAVRDYSGFRVAQRALVQELLLAGRFALAAATSLDGTPALLVHAGLSTRELSILGCSDERAPAVLARELNAWLDRAVARVAPRWSRGELAALELEPLHVTGTAGREGGGFLYHRPVNLGRANRKETELDLDPARPRRFSVDLLPRDLVQIVGHTAHKRSREELLPWVGPRAQAREFGGGLRTLVYDDHPTYDLGVLPHRPGAATVVMIDGGLSDERIADAQVLPIAPPIVPR